MALAVTCDGMREILGLWGSETGYRCGTTMQCKTKRAGNLNGSPALISVEPRGFEPLTFCLPDKCSTS